MIGWTQRERLIAVRGPRHVVVGTVRRDEFRCEYRDDAASADALAERWREDGLRQVYVIAPVGAVDEAMLRDLGRQWRQARDDERAVADLTKAAMRVAAGDGVAETTLADLVGVDRMTVRRALGKPR